MKKLLPLLLLFIASIGAKAQIACSPAFSFQFLTSTNIKFTPAVTVDSPFVIHDWNFGDGTFIFNYIAPTHNYTANGVYTVKHVIRRLNPNGLLICNDSTTQTITIQQATCNVTASFTSSASTANPLQWNFVNTTANFNSADSIRWTFGDGTSSVAINPNHTYTSPGTYTVCLRVRKFGNIATTPPCISEVCQQIVVTAPSPNCNIQAYFTHDSVNVNTIHFTNQTGGFIASDSIRWSFGDGTFSLDVNPNHTYTSPGNYTVCVRVKRNFPAGTSPCVSEYCKVVTIYPTPTSCNLVANFTSYRDSGAIALYTYQFINTSVGAAASDSIRWTFGDGTSSNQFNPSHVYAQPGTYNVCLRIIKRNPNGVLLTNCVSEKCYTIIIAPVCNLQANYTWIASTANYKTIIFTNTSIVNTTNFTTLWNFGDGSTTSTFNATHTYANPGTYNVCVTIQSGNCTATKCYTITIVQPMPACTQLANYTVTSTTTPNGQLFSFTPSYIGNDVTYTWTFGDGTGATTTTATHSYTTPGNYTVCLTAYRNNSCAATKCSNVYSAPNCNGITLGYNSYRDSLVPNRVTFVAASNSNIVSQTWTITRMPATAGTGTATINQNNPTYVFLDSGYYTVCIRATFSNGCVKTFCNNIYIASPMPTTNTCSLQLYPNPATSIVNAAVTLTAPTVINATIFNAQNVQVLQQQQQGVVGNNIVSFNVSNLTAGAYIFRVVYGNQVCYATFIKQ